MRFLISFLCFSFVSAYGLGAQQLQVWTDLPDSIYVGELSLGTIKELTLSIRNNGSMTANIAAPVFTDSYEYQSMTVSCNPAQAISLAPHETATFSVRIMARHNMSLHGWLSFSMSLDSCSELRKDILIWGAGVSNDIDYTFNREYSVLYDSLHAHVNNHICLTYKPAREMMFGKADNVNDSVECIYTGKILKTAGIPPNGEFNTEHSWVQSRGSSVDPNKSDVNHLYPTNPNANSIRANYPYGNVVKVWKDAGGGSRLGFAVTGDTVFEPRDVSKGNIARGIFYYLVRYGNLTDYYTTPYNMDHDLRAWNAMDPPDAREKARCDTISVYQGKRNPFIDHPEFAERLDFIPTTHTNILRALRHQFYFTRASDSTLFECRFVNVSKDSIRIAQVTYDHPDEITFDATDTAQSLAPHSTRLLHFSYKRLSLGGTPGYIHISVQASGSQNAESMTFMDCETVGVEQEKQINVAPVYPQPMREWCRVDLSSAAQRVDRVALYSLQGNMLCDLSPRIEQGSETTSVKITSTDCLSEKVVVVRAVLAGRIVTRVVIVE